MLSSRTLLSLPDLDLLVARGQVDGLSSEELAFTAGEIQQLAEQNFSRQPRPRAGRTSRQAQRRLDHGPIAVGPDRTVAQRQPPCVSCALRASISTPIWRSRCSNASPTMFAFSYLRTSLMEDFDVRFVPGRAWPSSFRPPMAVGSTLSTSCAKTTFSSLKSATKNAGYATIRFSNSSCRTVFSIRRPRMLPTIADRLAQVYIENGNGIVSSNYTAASATSKAQIEILTTYGVHLAPCWAHPTSGALDRRTTARYRLTIIPNSSASTATAWW